MNEPEPAGSFGRAGREGPCPAYAACETTARTPDRMGHRPAAPYLQGMAHGLLTAAILLALAGSALVGGTLFGFSAFVMPALGRLAPPEAIRAMQAINVAALRPPFMIAFLGTAVAALAVGAWALLGPAGAMRSGLLTGSLLYLVGVFAVTAVVHVPRNDALARVNASAADGAAAWARYASAWTAWNHLRAAAGAAATLAYALALGAGA